ncbi:hypothetical protein CLOP_g20440 [Closterium sp. NIES-67]|nr:hypothetical protein CLOP_g20440 [Closterium sp. NIES-67]
MWFVSVKTLASFYNSHVKSSFVCRMCFSILSSVKCRSCRRCVQQAPINSRRIYLADPGTRAQDFKPKGRG